MCQRFKYAIGGSVPTLGVGNELGAQVRDVAFTPRNANSVPSPAVTELLETAVTAKSRSLETSHSQAGKHRRSLQVISGAAALAASVLAACSSDEPGGAATAGSGGGDRAGSSGAATGGKSGGTGGRSGSAGSSAGTAGKGASGDSSTGGTMAGGTSSGGTAGRAETGGTTGSGGAGGRSSTGGASAGGGGGVSGASGEAGASGNGGAANGGMAGTAGTAGTVSGARCPDETWSVTWGDDFDGPAGSAVDGSKWAYDSGPNWYNGELQYYAAGTDNASLDGNGNLVIEARQQTREGRQYTSARLKTEGKKTFTYGRFEGRMKLPYGQGIWPAFWMLGGNSWPNTGEIDIMENLGREPSIAYGTIHGPGYSGAAGPSASYTLPGNAAFADDFHVFAIEWETNVIRWYVDDTHFSTKTPADIGGNNWVFDHGFFFILNLAVGGEWPGNPDGTTVFPQKFVIDYVRVCEK
jgi:beta-glucanase (GH16 family)